MIKRLKRRLSLTLRGGRAGEDSLSELAEQLTIEETSDIAVRENGEFMLFCSLMLCSTCISEVIFIRIVMVWRILPF